MKKQALLGSGLLLFWPALAQQPADSQDLASLGGIVVTSTGEPLAGTVVTLTKGRTMAGRGTMIPGKAYPAPPPEVAGTLTTGADGRFSFPGIAPGPYVVRAEHAGFNPGAYGAGRPGAPQIILSVPSGAHIDNLRVSLSQRFETTLNGRIINQSGRGIGGATVMLVQATRPMGRLTLVRSATVTADRQGRYTIGDQNVPPGTYYLLASTWKSGLPKIDPASSGDVTTWYPGVTDIASATPVQVGIVGGTQNLDIRMAKGAVYSVRGKVTGNFPHGSLRVVVTAADNSANPLVGWSTLGPNVSDSGSFDVELPGAGSYYLTLTNSSGPVVSLGCQRIQVDHGDLDGVGIAYQPSRELRGVVRMEPAAAGTPATPQPMRISLAAPGIITNANSAIATPNADGSFVFPDLAPGAYRVGVIPMPPGLYLKSVSLGSQAVADSGIIDFLSGSEPGPLTITLGADGGSVSGSVISASAGGRVSVMPDGPAASAARYRSVSVNPSGHFTLAGLPPGAYRVYAWETPDLPALSDPEYLKAFAASSLLVEVKPRADTPVKLTAIPAD
jgi:hypothetical protein